MPLLMKMPLVADAFSRPDKLVLSGLPAQCRCYPVVVRETAPFAARNR